MEHTYTMGVGLRGTGQVAVQHVRAVEANPHTAVVAVCGRNIEHSRQFAAQYAPQAKVYANYEDMLADPSVDIVSECMPNYLHAEEGCLALRAGKHVMLEKPAGITEQETEDLFCAAESSKQKSVVSFVLRWHPMVQNIRNLLNKKAFGEVYYAEADYWHGISPKFSSYPWIRQKQFAGGAMITGGSHAVDILRYLHGEIAEVSAYSVKKREDFDYPTTYVSALSFCDGTVGKVSASLDGVNFPYQFNIDLLGTAGICRDNRFYARELFPNQEDWMNFTCDTPNSGKVSHHPFKAEFDNLVDAILHDAPVLCDIQDACRSMRVVHAITRSAAEGKPVAI